MNSNIPREKVNWHPTINLDNCTGDYVCFEFCENGVFVWDDENRHPIVQNPMKCALGCDACAQQCPVEAITFPSKSELRATLHRLQAEGHLRAAPPPAEEAM